jgi:hypothetical protein
VAKSINYVDGELRSSKKHHRKIKFLLILLAVLIVIGGAVDYIMSKFNASVSGNVTNPSTTQQNAGLSFDFTPIQVNGIHISFTYPRAMSVYSAAQKASFPILESYVYKYSDSLTWLLAVAVTQLSADNLMTDSSYSIRVQDPAIYQPSTVTINQKTYKVMTDTTAVGFSEIAFSLHDNMDCTISLLGNDNLGITNLQKVFDMVIGSFSWR